MNRSRFKEKQVMWVRQEAETGEKAQEVCRQHSRQSVSFPSLAEVASVEKAKPQAVDE